MALTSFSSALNGLNANTHTINVVGDNLANLNTTGFKSGQATFAEIIGGLSGFSDTNNPIVFGQGSKLNGITHKQTQGSADYTGISSDAMIYGDGYFVVDTGDGEMGYTRAGRFQFTKDGKLVSSDNYQLLGYMAEDGKIDLTKSIQTLEIRLGQLIPANKTTEMSVAMNLDSQGSIRPTTTVSVTGNLNSAGDGPAPDPVTVTVYDSDNNPHDLELTFTYNTGTNEWKLQNATCDTVAMDVDGNYPVDLTNHRLTYTAAGPPSFEVDFVLNLSSISRNTSDTGLRATNDADRFATPITVFDSLGAKHDIRLEFEKTNVAGDVPTWTMTAWLVGENGHADRKLDINSSPSLDLDFTSTGVLTDAILAGYYDVNIPVDVFGTGIPAENIRLNMQDAEGRSLITSVASKSATSSVSQNGYAASNLTSIAFDKEGRVIGTAENGNNVYLAQLALATFTNAEGLQKYNGSTLIASGSAGEPSIGTAGTGRRGSVQGSSLEMSNVDMAEEFIRLITAERAYQANARVITTSDEIYQQAVSLKR